MTGEVTTVFGLELRGDAGVRTLSTEELNSLPEAVLWDIENIFAAIARRYAETHPGFRLSVSRDLMKDQFVIEWRTRP